MKKYLTALLATLACISAGCQSDIEKEEIAKLLTSDVRCTMTGGKLYTEDQAHAIGDVKNVVDSKACWTMNGSTAALDTSCDAYDALKKRLGGKVPDGLNSGMTQLKNDLGGAWIAFATKPMASIYSMVKTYVPEGSNEAGYYCGCGYDICDIGTSCSMDAITQIPICAYDKQDTNMAAEICDPVIVRQNPLKSVLLNGLFPIMQKLGEFATLMENFEGKEPMTVEGDERGDLLPVDESGKYYFPLNPCAFKSTALLAENTKVCMGEYLFTKGEDQTFRVITAQLFSFIIDCVNYDSLSADAKKTYKCWGTMKNVPLGTIRPGITNSGMYFNDFRRMANDLITQGMTQAQVAALDEEVLGDAIDDFLTKQVQYILTARSTLVGEASVLKILTAHVDEKGNLIAKDGSNISDDAILTGLNTFYENAYRSYEGQKITISDKSQSQINATTDSEYLIRRKFFAALASYVMGTQDLNSAFGVNLDCIAGVSGIGDPAGLKKYCSANESQPIDTKTIYTALENNVDNRIALLDALIGRDAASNVHTATLSATDEMGNPTTIIIDSLSDNNRITYQRFNASTGKPIDEKPVTYGGKWLGMRCPNGASCQDSNCGACGNTEIPHKIVNYSSSNEVYEIHENAICINGKIVDVVDESNVDWNNIMPDTLLGTASCTTGTTVCKEFNNIGYVAVCKNGTVEFLGRDSCIDVGCNADMNNCNNDYSCTAAEVNQPKCFHGSSVGQGGAPVAGTIMTTCQLKSSDGTYNYTPSFARMTECLPKMCSTDRKDCI
jgi:hypothetical protein